MLGVFDSELLFNQEGRIKQLEFIKKTTELGNTTVALSNSKIGVLIVHVPKRTKLAEPQEKVFEINSKTLFTFSGITNHGLSIVRYLKGGVLRNAYPDPDDQGLKKEDVYIYIMEQGKGVRTFNSDLVQFE